MGRLLALVMVGALCVGFIGCGGSGDKKGGTENQEKETEKEADKEASKDEKSGS